MRVCDFISSLLHYSFSVTDAFGVPGGGIVQLIHSMSKLAPKLTPHLMCHEQNAGFAACGYSQKSGKLGVAYATRGPGFTNLITSIAEAFQESLPVLFITSHSNEDTYGTRFDNNQEIDTIAIASNITKFAFKIDRLNDVFRVLMLSCKTALNDRKGPVLLDINSTLWNKQIGDDFSFQDLTYNVNFCSVSYDKQISENILLKINLSSRPVFLIGEGIRNILKNSCFKNIFKVFNIPILSSRGAQDIICDSDLYYGYIGSHGIRYANYILAKADLIVSIGNRMAVPLHSESFGQIFKNTEIIRIDVDQDEFLRDIPNSTDFCCNAYDLFIDFCNLSFENYKSFDIWRKNCDLIRDTLYFCDITMPVGLISNLLKKIDEGASFVVDVGNNEFWFSRAFEFIKPKCEVLISKSFGSLGCSIGKSIGVYLASRQQVYCVIGDHGFQLCSQELFFIAKSGYSIKIIIINNQISGMILDYEKKIFGDDLIHVSSDNGYLVPNIKSVCKAYNLFWTTSIDAFINYQGAAVIELSISKDVCLTPTLPKGRSCCDMEPKLNEEILAKLNSI